jgi:L-amino acid N-acyltransferase YncA
LAVVSEHRGKGMAKALVKSIEEVLENKGFKIIATLVEDGSPVSMKLFSDAGYKKHDDIHYLTKRESDDV